jgi:hypothetical protein
VTAGSRARRAPAPKQELWEAAQAAVQDARERTARRQVATGRRASGTRLRILIPALMLFVLGVYLIAERPAWFFTADPAPEPVEITEASRRLAIVREAQRVRHYQARTGHLPAALGELGPFLAGLRYRPGADGSFELSFPGDGGDLVLRSTESESAFLGASLRTILSRENGGSRP